MSTDHLLQLLVAGTSVGALYGLLALGFITIYNCSRVVNFAQGEFVMLGALFTVYLLKVVGLPYGVAAVVAVAAVTLVGVLMYQSVIAPLGQAPILTLVLATLGASLVLQNSALIAWGPFPTDLPGFSGSTPIRLNQVAVLPQSLWVILMTGAALASIYLLINRTRLGKEMIATATDPLAANLVGISTDSVARWSFAISASLGALAGIIVAPLVPMSYSIGLTLGLKGIVAALLGGWGKSTGAFVGGLVLGVLETFSAGLLPAGYKDATAFAVMILMLYFRPSGIMGASLPEAD